MELVDELRNIERIVLNKLYLEHIAMCMRGIMLAKEIREERKKKAKEKDSGTPLFEGGLKNE